MSEGLKNAVFAIAFYRVRHVYRERPDLKGGKGCKVRRVKDISKSASNQRMCRLFIRMARAAGFRGSTRTHPPTSHRT